MLVHDNGVGVTHLVNVVSALVLIHLGLLVQDRDVLSGDHLLATAEILDISTSFRRLLTLLLF